MKITFLGDIMAEPPVLKAAKKWDGYDFSGVFAPVKKLLKESDFVVGNLETPLPGKTDTPFIAQMQQDIRTAKQNADVVLFHPPCGRSACLLSCGRATQNPF